MLILISIHIKRLFERRMTMNEVINREQLERYLQGYLNQEIYQSNTPKGDIQISSLRVVLASILGKHPNTTIFDIGMGKGILVDQISETADSFYYVGIDRSIDMEAVKNSGIATSLLQQNRAQYWNFRDMEKNICSKEWGPVLFVVRNVIHEMDPLSLLILFRTVLRIKAKTIHLIIQDMSQLPYAEIAHAPWLEDDILAVLKGLGIESYNSDYCSKSDTPIYTIVGEIAKDLTLQYSSDLRVLLLLQNVKKNRYDSLLASATELIQNRSLQESRFKLPYLQNDLFATGIFLSNIKDLIDQTKSQIVLSNNKHIDRSDRRIEFIPWADIQTSTLRFINYCIENRIEYDMILGVAKGGLPIATIISNYFNNAAFAVVLKEYINESTGPFSVFKGQNITRSYREKRQEWFYIRQSVSKIKRVLIVDDVSTFGHALKDAATLVYKEFGSNIQIDYYTHALDPTRLATEMPDVYDNTISFNQFDNDKIWYSFPWENIDLLE